MEALVTSPRLVIRCVLLLALCLAPSLAFAQAATPAPPADNPAPSGWWVVAGGAFATVRGSCQTCEEDYPYRHTGGILANIGHRFSDRVDAGAEVFWVPMTNDEGTHVNTTHVDGVVQFRPWASKGMFFKAGAGMAFVRNWLDAPDAAAPINSKALSVVIGAGWAFRPAKRLGLQIFGTQHAAALGDFQTSSGDVQDVIGNFWSLGIGIVIR
jgi:hypothetical protein